MLVCCVPGCTSRYTPNGIRFHSLPQGLRNEQRRKMWEKNIGKQLTPKSVVCEFHFTPDQFEQNRLDGKKLLRWNAVPTIFPLRRMKRPFRLKEETNDCESFESPPPPAKQPASVNPHLSFISIDGKPLKAIPENTPIKLVQCIPIDNQKIVQFRKDTTPGFVPIAPKIEASSYVSIPQIEIDEYKREIQRYKDDIHTYNKRINMLISNVRTLAQDKTRQSDKLKKIFNDDQIKCLSRDDLKDDDINWGYKTVDKAAELYKVCGSDGYNLILSHNLPYPSVNILKKLKPELFNVNCKITQCFNDTLEDGLS